jgi:dihydrolipoamide dehydrogenase
MTESFDVVVLGGGPGGYVAALRAAQHGLSVCLIEKEFLGGACLNHGCIPTKTLLTSVDLYNKILKAPEWGIELKTMPEWNLNKLFEKKESVVFKIRQGLNFLCKKRKIRIVIGFGTVLSSTQVQVGEDIYGANHIIIATGSSAKTPNSIGISGAHVWTSREALSRHERLPESLLILGAGPEGCEFSQIYSALGAKVTLIEAKERILPGFDSDAADALHRNLKLKGIEVMTGQLVKKFDEVDKKIECVLSDGKKIAFDNLLISAGRVPNSSNIGAESIGLSLNARGFIETNEYYETHIKNIYAIGDVNGKSMMAHSASYQGYLVADVIAKGKKPLQRVTTPSCVYTNPEIAQVGLNEASAKEGNIDYQVGRFSFLALGRSHAKGQTEGFVKIIGDAKNYKILGAVVVGDGASEIINMITLAIQKEMTVTELREHIAPHPSATEAVAEAAHLFFKEGLHFA